MNDIDKFISSIDNTLYNRIRQSKSDAECRRYLKEHLLKQLTLQVVGKPKGELLNVSFNVGDKVLFNNKKGVVLWTSVNYLDIELVGTNKILQGVHTSKVFPR